MDAKLNTFDETTKKNVVEKENNPLIVNGLDPVLQAAKTRINLAVPYGAARLNVSVCICKGIAPKVVKKTTLGDFIKSLSNGDPLSISTSESLKNAYLSYRATGDKKPYDAIKQGLNGVVFGDYSTRKDSDCTAYIGLMGLDIDGYNDPVDMSFDLSEFKKNPYVFAAFPSPSNHGLRVLVWTDSTFETHKATYKSLLSFMSNTLNISTDKDQKPHLDGATFNPSRLWFFTHTTDVYLNLDSQVYTPSVLAATDTQAATVATSKSAKSDVKKPHTHDGTLTDAQKIDACTEMSKQRNKTDGTHDRNNFVFNTACLCFEHGVTSDAILSHFTTAYSAEDFTAAEIKKTVNSAEKKAQFGIYTDAQLMKYIKNGDPLNAGPGMAKTATATPATSSAATMAATPSVSKAKTAKIKPETTANDGDASDGDDDAFDDRKTPKITLVKNYLSRKKDFRLNEISFRIEVSPKGKNQFDVLNKADLYCELLENARLNGIKDILDNLMQSSFIPKFNPIKDYFENSPKKWDTSQPDFIAMFSSHIKAKDQFWFNTQFKKALVRTVACGLGVISFNKQCFTLVGKQNDGKSSLIRFLADTPKLKPYIKENPRMEHKDSLFALARNLILNYDELDSATKADVAKLKSYFSIGDFQERKHFGDFDESFVRVGSFFGSTNRTDFLNDETGSVRWLVMEIDGIDFDYKQKIDIDWVWAQAYFLLKNGFDFQMSKDEISYSEKSNKRFTQTSYEMELIQDHYTAGTPEDFDFFWNARKISDDLGGANQKLVFEKIGSALKKLGFIQERKWSAETRNTINGYYLKKL